MHIIAGYSGHISGLVTCVNLVTIHVGRLVCIVVHWLKFNIAHSVLVWHVAFAINLLTYMYMYMYMYMMHTCRRLYIFCTFTVHLHVSLPLLIKHLQAKSSLPLR